MNSTTTNPPPPSLFAADHFESPRILIDGAKTDIANLAKRCDAFVQSCTCVPVEDMDRQSGHKIIKLKISDRVPRDSRYIASNIVNNLRHALDQAVNASAIALGATKRDCYFPFAKDEAEIDQRIADVCKRVPQEIKTLLRNFQPYGGGDDILYAMSKLAGTNKHQIILHLNCDLTHFSAADAGIVQFTGPGQVGYIGWDSQKQELELAHLLSSSSQLKLNGNPKLPIYIALAGAGPLSGEHAARALNLVAGKIDRIVGAIEAETARMIRAS